MFTRSRSLLRSLGLAITAGALGLALSACGTTAAAAGGADAVDNDATGATDALADASSTVDVSGATDAIGNDAVGTDASGGPDVAVQDMAGQDVADGNSPADSKLIDGPIDSFTLGDGQPGGWDVVPNGDASLADIANDGNVPPPDLIIFDSATLDVASDPKCASLCQVIAAAKCPNDGSFAECVAGCSTGLATAPACTSLMYAMIDCAVGQTLACDGTGKSIPPASCSTQGAAFETCFKNNGGGGCSGGSSCAADSNGNCGCTGCGGQYGMDCQGGTCTCLLNGTATSQTFPASGVCTNPGPTMDAKCKPAP